MLFIYFYSTDFLDVSRNRIDSLGSLDDVTHSNDSNDVTTGTSDVTTENKDS